MALSKIRLGDYIGICDKRNSESTYGENSVRGISIEKRFIPTKANLADVDLKGYTLVEPRAFAYVTVTSRNGNKISIAYNFSSETYIVSSTYVVFSVISDKIIPEYLYILFNRPEFDRFSRYNSWGSARETFSWEDLCDIKLELPDIETQQKYVDIYMGLKKNIEAYENGMDDLKLVCDAYIENLRKTTPCEEIGAYTREITNRNSDLKITDVKGVSNSQFIPTKANTTGLDFSSYKIVRSKQFAYNPARINIGSIALLNDDICIVSPMYIVFEITDIQRLMPEYLMMWLSREEFLRSTSFYAIGSVRDIFDYDSMKSVKIPIPDISVQQSIVNIYNAYNNRKSIAERLKTVAKDICPILIKGSVEEAEIRQPADGSNHPLTGE